MPPDKLHGQLTADDVITGFETVEQEKEIGLRVAAALAERLPELVRFAVRPHDPARILVLEAGTPPPQGFAIIAFPAALLEAGLAIEIQSMGEPGATGRGSPHAILGARGMLFGVWATSSEGERRLRIDVLAGGHRFSVLDESDAPSIAGIPDPAPGTPGIDADGVARLNLAL